MITGYQIITSTGGVVVAPDAEWTTVYMQAMIYAPQTEIVANNVTIGTL